jgi:hypothetical protein
LWHAALEGSFGSHGGGKKWSKRREEKSAPVAAAAIEVIRDSLELLPFACLFFGPLRRAFS